MNLYQLHSDPKSLDHHDLMHETNPMFFFTGYNTRVAGEKAKYIAMLKSKEKCIAKSAKYSYEYVHITNKPFPLGEPVIATNADISRRWYAENILMVLFHWVKKLLQLV